MIKYFSKDLRSARLVLKHLEPNIQNAKIIFAALKNENPQDYKYEPLMKNPKILPTSVSDTLKMMQYHAESEKNDACIFYIFHNSQFIGVRKISFYKILLEIYKQSYLRK